MLDGMSSRYALPCRSSTVNGPMNLGASLLAPKSDTACLGKFCVANKTNEPFLNSFMLPLPTLSAFSFCRSTEAAIASCTNRITACLRWTKSSAFELNPFSSSPSSAAGPACSLSSLMSVPGTDNSRSFLLERGAERVTAADSTSSAVLCGCSDATVDPPPLKEEATPPSMLGKRGCRMAFT